MGMSGFDRVGCQAIARRGARGLVNNGQNLQLRITPNSLTLLKSTTSK